MGRPYIEVHIPGKEAERFELAREVVTIGRSSRADISVEQSTLSRIHAKIEQTVDGRWKIFDLGSLNKTYYNARVIKSHLLRNNDELYLGSMRVVFVDPTGRSSDGEEQTLYEDQRANNDRTADGICAIGSLAKARRVVASSPEAMEVHTGAAPFGQMSLFDEPLGGYGEANKSANPQPFHLQSLLRYKWSILLIFVLIAAPSIAAVWMLVAPEYTAKGQICVQPIIPRLVYSTDENGPIPYYNTYVNTQASYILSPELIRRVLEEPKVQQTQWYRQPPKRLLGGPPDPTESLLKTLDVHPSGQTWMIDVSMRCRNPEDAVAIVDTVLNKYMQYTRNTIDQDQDILFRQLRDAYKLRNDEVEGIRRTVAELRRQLGIGTPEQLILQMKMRLDTNEATLEGIRQQIALAHWQEEHLEKLVNKNAEKQDGTGEADNQHQSAQYVHDPEWRNLDLTVKTSQHELKLQQKQLGESHPTIVAMRERVKFNEELRKQRERQLDDLRLANSGEATGGGIAKSPQMELDVLRQQIEQLKFQEAQTNDAITALKAKADQMFTTAELLEKENETLRQKRELCEEVRQQLVKKEMERSVPGSISIAANAFASSEPSHDRRILFSAMALMLALAAGVGTAFARAQIGQTLHEADDLSRMAQAPFLGQLPFVTRDKRSILDEDPIQNECMRMVRTALLERLNGQSGSVVLVTSAEPEAGKTTVAVLLAKSLAQCGKKVLLVDADLRNPAVAQRLGVNSEPGLVASLTARATDSQAIAETDTPRLSVLPAGVSRSGTDPELLADGVFSVCLSRWRQQYDIVILDSPPVLPVADARILSRHADGAIMVAREGHCRRDEVVDALAYLSTAGGKLFGTVFIGSSRRGGYGAGYYGNYGSYGKVETSIVPTRK